MSDGMVLSLRNLFLCVCVGVLRVRVTRQLLAPEALRDDTSDSEITEQISRSASQTEQDSLVFEDFDTR